MTSFPTRLSPMLAHIADQPFDSPNHYFEIKWDGIRCIALLHPTGNLTLQSRNFKDITAKFPELADLPASCRATSAVFDGELVVLNFEAKPDFSLIQRRVRSSSPGMISTYSRQYPATYMVFDLLYQNNQALFHFPLSQRKEILSAVLSEEKNWVITRAVEGLGRAYATVVFGQGFEGIMAKDKTSPYLPGKRSEFWLKIKNRQKLMATIIGFTASPRATTISALVLAQKNEDNHLTYIGRVGTGFSHQEGAKLLHKFAGELVPTPAITVPVSEDGIWWVKPINHCWVEYMEFTHDGVLRHPVYRGLVQDE